MAPRTEGAPIYTAVAAKPSCEYECCEAVGVSDPHSQFLNWKQENKPEFCCYMVDADRQNRPAKYHYKECCEADLAYDTKDSAGVWVEYDEKNKLTYTVKVPCPTEPDSPEKYKCETQELEGYTCCDPDMDGHNIDGGEDIMCCPPGGDDTETCCPLKPGYTWNDTTKTCEQCVDNCDIIPGGCVVGEHCKYGKVLEEDEEVSGTYCVGTTPDTNVCCQTAALGYTDAGVFNPACCLEKDCVFVQKPNITPINCTTGQAITSSPSNPQP